MGTEKYIEMQEIIRFLKSGQYDFTIVGCKDIKIKGYSSLNQYKEDTVTWIKKQENWHSDRGEDVLLCIVQKGVQIDAPNQIICDKSQKLFFDLINEMFEKEEMPQTTIGKNTVIDERVVLGKNVRIGNNCALTGKIVVGDDTVISDNVVIKNRVEIGDRCVIQALSVIGEDGFGYIQDEDNKKTMIRHYGGVSIGDDVFIGAHVNIARGTIDDTVIESGVKIAPSTHIGHNNHIRKDATVICSQLYGSVSVGENAYIVGSIIRNQCGVGKNSFIGMGSVVTKNIASDKVAIGIPARIVRDNV